jgi:hypothetical protein
LKKLIAYILLFAILFNTGGKLLLHQYLAWQSDRVFNRQTEKGLYNVNDLTEVMIPNEMVNIADWNNFEKVSGRVVFQNASYNYEKIKITRHAIYLMCVPNYVTTRLSDQNIIIAKNISDIPVSKKDHVPYGKTTLLDKLSLTFASGVTPPCKILHVDFIPEDEQLINHPTEIPVEPPRFRC